MEMDVLQQVDEDDERIAAPDHHEQQHHYKQPTDHIDLAVESLSLLLLGYGDAGGDWDYSLGSHGGQSDT